MITVGVYTLKRIPPPIRHIIDINSLPHRTELGILESIWIVISIENLYPIRLPERAIEVDERSWKGHPYNTIPCTFIEHGKGSGLATQTSWNLGILAGIGRKNTPLFYHCLEKYFRKAMMSKSTCNTWIRN